MHAGPETTEAVQRLDALRAAWMTLSDQLESVVIGQTENVRLLTIATLCQGHTLIVGEPGVAKTTLVRALARSLDLRFARIQFTPDMMPSDLMGSELLQIDADSGRRSLEFHPGPIFTNFVLADEINRAPPKTQAALLEAMQERQVSVGGRTMDLDAPFIVVATQNPIEHEGVYPLPEAQLDRFMFSLRLGYPSAADEARIACEGASFQAALESLTPALGARELGPIAALLEEIPVSPHVAHYAVALARATRPDEPGAPEIVRECVAFGAGPRGAQALVRAARAAAALEGEVSPGPAHVRAMLKPALRHRLTLRHEALARGVDPDAALERVLQGTREPDLG